MVRDGLIDCCLRAVVRMIPAGVVPSRSFFSLSHRLVAEEDQKAKKTKNDFDFVVRSLGFRYFLF